jgi:hypothetical protein
LAAYAYATMKALLEVMDGKLDAILEARMALFDVHIEDRLGRVEDDVLAIKAAVKDQGQELKTLSSDYNAWKRP